MPLPWQTKIDGIATEDELWMLFHENSKSSPYDPTPTDEAVLTRVLDLWDALPYEGYEHILLPTDLAPLDGTVRSAILSRSTARALSAGPLTLIQLATLLHCAYGITRNNNDGSFPRPFRASPSAGRLYPLELYVHTARVEGLTAGLYHFNPRERCLVLLQPGDSSRQIGAALLQPELALNTGMMIFITAIFERVIFKYGDRGYRFTLLEAGHVAQNVNIVATALGLGCVNIGGFIDREIDNWLGLDGIGHSTLYLVGIGQNSPDLDLESLE